MWGTGENLLLLSFWSIQICHVAPIVYGDIVYGQAQKSDPVESGEKTNLFYLFFWKKKSYWPIRIKASGGSKKCRGRRRSSSTKGRENCQLPHTDWHLYSSASELLPISEHSLECSRSIKIKRKRIIHQLFRRFVKDCVSPNKIGPKYYTGV